MARVKRWVIVLLIIAVAIPVMGVVTFPVWFPAAAREALQVAGTKALGVEVKVDNIETEIFEGRGTLDGLTIANPQGFEKELFVSMGYGSFRVDLESDAQKLVIPEITIDELTVNLEEASPHNNWEVILGNIDKYVGPPDPDAAESPTGFVIERVVVTNITAEYRASVAGVLKPAVRIEIDELILEDIADDNPPEGGEIMAVLVREILRGIGRAAVGLPKTVVTGLVNGVGGVIGGVAKIIGLKKDEKKRPGTAEGEKEAKPEKAPPKEEAEGGAVPD
jgi:hypothetical protein